MNIAHLHEPRLLFADGTHICPRRGIAEYGVFDQAQTTRRSEIYIGGIGTSNCVDLLDTWLKRSGSVIAAASDVKQENLRLPFCGFNRNSGFAADMRFSADLFTDHKKLRNKGHPRYRGPQGASAPCR